MSAIATGMLLYACIVLGMTSISCWAERELDAFPFKEEDWLRYLLPSRFTDDEKTRIMLTGPSTVRENLLYRQFEEAFPQFSVYQGGISLGTIDDVTASLEYIEKVYGSRSLPAIVVLGISPRFIDNIPDERPFSLGLNLYSPFYAAHYTDAGIELVPRGPVDSLKARLEFLTRKQPERFRTAMLAVLSHWLSGGEKVNLDPHADTSRKTGRQALLDRMFKHPLSTSIIRNGQFKRALDFEFTQVLAWLISPYKYLLSEPRDVEKQKQWLTNPDSWWRTVQTWDPKKTRPRTTASLKRFTRFIKNHNIRLLVVNLPERDISRELFQDENYQAYLDIVTQSLDDALFIDLREFLASDEFYDSEHTIYRGSLRLTDEVVGRLAEMLQTQENP